MYYMNSNYYIYRMYHTHAFRPNFQNPLDKGLIKPYLYPPVRFEREEKQRCPILLKIKALIVRVWRKNEELLKQLFWWDGKFSHLCNPKRKQAGKSRRRKAGCSIEKQQKEEGLGGIKSLKK